MKKLITADVHIHSHFNNPIFINIGVDYLEYIHQYCLNNNIRTIDIAGDLFHISSKIDIEIYLPIFNQLDKMAKNGLEINIIPGNHERHKKHERTILDALSPYCNIFNEYTVKKQDNTNFHYLPFEREFDFSILSPVKDEVNILISHFNVAGFKMNETMVSSGIELSTNIKQAFKWIILGDLHIHQKIGNIVYTGSPYQQNFGEIGQKKGFLVYDTETNDWEFKEYDNYPKFKLVNVNSCLDEDLSNSFIKLQIDKKIDNLSKLREILFDRGALEISQVFEIKEEQKELEKMKLNTFNSLSEIIKEYISQDVTELDKNKLLKTLDRIIL